MKINGKMNLISFLTPRLCFWAVMSLLVLTAQSSEASRKGVSNQKTTSHLPTLAGASPAVEQANKLDDKTTAKHPNILFVIADDWSYPHAGIYGDKIVKTPNFDRVAREGALFTNAYTASPSCTPSRGAVLTGQAVHRLAEGSSNRGFLSNKFAVYPDLLEAANYYVGYSGKGWGPGSLKGSGRTRNPAGPIFKSFAAFLDSKPENKPFCFWFGSTRPHRAFVKGSGLRAGMRLEAAVVPAFLPDTPEVRSDLLDYYVSVQQLDDEIGDLLKRLEASGQIDNTMIVVTSDNGMPFPRVKANIYDAGTRMPLAIRYPAQIKPGRVINDFISLTDLAPTFLEAAGLKPPDEMTGRSFIKLFRGKKQTNRERVFFERERHGNSRTGNQGYPVRAVRTGEFLYIRNLRPNRYPAGDPDVVSSQGAFGDTDASPTKDLLLNMRADENIFKYFQLAFAVRPAEELYDLRRDPQQIVNVADQPQYAEIKSKLRQMLDKWMRETADPRTATDDDRWDRYVYYPRDDRWNELEGQ